MRILQREAQIHVQRAHVWWESCSGKLKSMFKQLTFDENPAAGSSNSRSRTSLLMRILQRKAKIHIQGDHIWWESCSGKLKSTFKELTFNENPAAGSSNRGSSSSLLKRILQREIQIHAQGAYFWRESCSGKLKSTFNEFTFDRNPAAGSSNAHSRR